MEDEYFEFYHPLLRNFFLEKSPHKGPSMA
jgi:hypothetical protein